MKVGQFDRKMEHEVNLKREKTVGVTLEAYVARAPRDTGCHEANEGDVKCIKYVKCGIF